MLLSRKCGAKLSPAATHDCSRVEGDAQDIVPVAARSTGEKVCPQVTLLCVHTGAPLQQRGGRDMGMYAAGLVCAR